MYHSNQYRNLKTSIPSLQPKQAAPSTYVPPSKIRKQEQQKKQNIQISPSQNHADIHLYSEICSIKGQAEQNSQFLLQSKGIPQKNLPISKQNRNRYALLVPKKKLLKPKNINKYQAISFIGSKNTKTLSKSDYQNGNNSALTLSFDRKKDIWQKRISSLVQKWLNIKITTKFQKENLKAIKKQIQVQLKERIQIHHLVEVMYVRDLLEENSRNGHQYYEDLEKISIIIQCIWYILKKQNKNNKAKGKSFKNIQLIFSQPRHTEIKYRDEQIQNLGRIKEEQVGSQEQQIKIQKKYRRSNTEHSSRVSTCNINSNQQQVNKYTYHQNERHKYYQHARPSVLINSPFKNSVFGENSSPSTYQDSQRPSQTLHSRNSYNIRVQLSSIYQNSNSGEHTKNNSIHKQYQEGNQEQSLKVELQNLSPCSKLRKNNSNFDDITLTSNAMRMQVDESKQNKRKQRSLLVKKPSFLNQSDQFKFYKGPNFSKFSKHYNSLIASGIEPCSFTSQNKQNKENKPLKHNFLRKRAGRYALVMQKLQNAKVMKHVADNIQKQNEESSISTITNSSRTSEPPPPEAPHEVNDLQSSFQIIQTTPKIQDEKLQSNSITQIQAEENTEKHIGKHNHGSAHLIKGKLKKAHGSINQKQITFSKEDTKLIKKKKVPVKKITRLNLLQSQYGDTSEHEQQNKIQEAEIIEPANSQDEKPQPAMKVAEKVNKPASKSNPFSKYLQQNEEDFQEKVEEQQTIFHKEIVSAKILKTSKKIEHIFKTKQDLKHDRELYKIKKKQLMNKLQILKQDFQSTFGNRIDIEGPSVFCQIAQNKRDRRNIFHFDDEDNFRKPKYINTTYSTKYKNAQRENEFQQEAFELDFIKRLARNFNAITQKNMGVEAYTPYV